MTVEFLAPNSVLWVEKSGGRYGVFEHKDGFVTLTWPKGEGKPERYEAKMAPEGELILKGKQEELVLKPAAGAIVPTALVGVWAKGKEARAIGASGYMAYLSSGEADVVLVKAAGDKLAVGKGKTRAAGEMTFKVEGDRLKLGTDDFARVSGAVELSADGGVKVESLTTTSR